MRWIVFYGVLILLILSSFGQTLSQDRRCVIASTTLFSVHIDEVPPANMKEFERLDATQSKVRSMIFRGHELPLLPGYSFCSPEGKYFSLRPRKSHAEFDQTPHYPDDVQKALKEKYNPYSDTVHMLLSMHHNEIWQLDTSGSYIPQNYEPSKMTFMYVRSEWVIPKMSERYDSVMNLFLEALAKINSPLACLTTFSSYGNGANIYLWHAHSAGELEQAKKPEEVLIAAFGKEKGEEIFRDWNSCLMRHEETDATMKPELTDLQPDMPWMGVTAGK